SMRTPMPNPTVTTDGHDTVVLSGKGSNSSGIAGVLQYQARVKVIPTGGSVTAAPADTSVGITVDKADSVTLLIAAATSYKNFNDVTGDPEAIGKNLLSSAS